MVFYNKFMYLYFQKNVDGVTNQNESCTIKRSLGGHEGVDEITAEIHTGLDFGEHEVSYKTVNVMYCVLKHVYSIPCVTIHLETTLTLSFYTFGDTHNKD